MRDRTQDRIEKLAAERGAEKIDLELVEAGIEIGLQLMKEMVGAYAGQKPASPSAQTAAEEPQAAECPVPASEQAQAKPASPKAPSKGNGNRQPLNEVSVMSELEKKRQELGEADA